MLRKKRWVIIGIVAAVVLLMAGVLGGVVIHAQSPTPSATTPSQENPEKTFADRVAGILGIDSAKVEAAFAQAQKEMQNDALKTRLDKLVEAGKITQQQADDYLKWWESRPDDVRLGPMGPNGGQIGPMQGPGFRGGFGCQPGFGYSAPGSTPSPTPSGS